MIHMTAANQPKTCVIYCRVSTDKQAQEGDSLPKQKRLCKRYADEMGWEVLEVYGEPYTGRLDNRPKFDEMMGYLFNNRGKVGYVVVLSIDRLTRGGSTSYNKIVDEIGLLGVKVRDTYRVIGEEVNRMAEYGDDITAGYDFAKKRPTKISETLMAEVKQDQIDEQLVRLVGAQIDNTQAGYWVGNSPDGMKTQKIIIEGSTKKKCILIPDSDRAHWYEKMFKLRAEGALSDQEICDKLNKAGYLSESRNKWDKGKTKIIGQTGNRPLTVKQMKVNLARPVYAGYVCKKWTRYIPVKAYFDGLVDVETFNKAN